MSSAHKVGELFKAAGHVLNQLADITMQIHMSPNQPSTGVSNRSKVKKKVHGESGLNAVAVSDTKRSPVTDQKVPMADVTVDQSVTSRTAKKNKLSEVTLSALNSPELDVDIEDLDDTSPPGKKIKLNFESDIDSGLL